MKPIEFKEQTKVLSKPHSMTDEECSPLSIWNGDEKTCISCWKSGLLGRIRFLFTGHIWLGILSGQTQPPVWVDTKRPFLKLEKEKK